MASPSPEPSTEPEPRLGPYRGPVVVLALMAVIVLGCVVISVVGAVRAPDDVSNSATVLGTFPIDPGVEGIPAGPAGTVPSGDDATTVPPGIGSAPAPPSSSTTPTDPTDPTDPGSDPEVVDAFDDDLAAWEPVDGEWAVADGALVVPAASDDAPAFLLRADEASAIGAEVAVAERAAGLVVGYADAGTYVAALAVPGLGGWRLEVRVDGDEVANASVPASTGAGTIAELVLRDGEALLVVDGVEAGSVAAPDGLGDRVGFVARGPAGTAWAAALAGPAG